jgi:hypothetical protein
VFAIEVRVPGKITAKMIRTVRPKNAMRRKARASVDERWCRANHNNTKMMAIKNS